MKYNKEILNIKSKTMIKKIDKLKEAFLMLPEIYNKKEVKSLEIIKAKYLEKYNKIIDSKEYDDYKNLEDIVVAEVAKLELDLDKYIHRTVRDYHEEIETRIQNIRKSENYQNFQNMHEVLKKVEALKFFSELYNPFLKEDEKKEIQDKISELKFEVLFRRQVEELIYKNGVTNCNLQYSDDQEKEIFARILKSKINSIKRDETEGELVFQAPIEQILCNNKLLNRLIVLDMENNPEEYINLVDAKIFNAHLCNINGRYPDYSSLGYTTKEKRRPYKTRPVLPLARYIEQQLEQRNESVFKSLLNAILKNLITDENVGIIECENLYNKFGYTCTPIAITIGQHCVKSLLAKVRKTDAYREKSSKLKAKKHNEEDQYCEVYLEKIGYDYDNENDKNDVLELLNEKNNKKKNVRKNLSANKEKKKTSKNQKQAISEEQIKNIEIIDEEGILTTDIINMIISFEKRIKGQYKEKVMAAANKLNDGRKGNDKVEQSTIEEIIEDMSRKINDKIKTLEKLKEIKIVDVNSDEFDLNNTIKLLESVNDIYRELTGSIPYNERKILPLECTEEKSVYPTWESFQKGFAYLGLKVENPNLFVNEMVEFPIYIRLNDISDLPIDYDKLKIVKRNYKEKGNER